MHVLREAAAARSSAGACCAALHSGRSAARRSRPHSCRSCPPLLPGATATAEAATALFYPPHQAGQRHVAPAANRSRSSKRVALAVAAVAADAGGSDLPHQVHVAPAAESSTAAGPQRVVLLTACVAMAMAAVHRVAFSVLSIPIQSELGLSLSQMGTLQSALLAGYVLGQVPCGVLADRIGGARLAATGLFLWSAVCLLFGLVPGSRNPFATLLAVRAALGLAQSCIMPAVGSLANRWFPPASRSQSTALVYSSYSFGTVAGLALTPFVAQHVGWASTFPLFGLAGMAAATIGSLLLPSESNAPGLAWQQRWAPPAPTAGAAAEATGSSSTRNRMDGETLAHLGVLIFTHSTISFSFFVLQAWIPSFLASSGMTRLSSIGLLSSLPWLATALVALLAGRAADRLQSRHGWSSLSVRHLMQTLAAGGTALSLLPLAVPGLWLPPLAAAAALTAAVAFQGCSYAGFHSYVPEVAPDASGLVLSITNTCGTLVGIAGNLLTGCLAEASAGYTGMFALTVVLQAATVAVWLRGAHGRKLQLGSKAG